MKANDETNERRDERTTKRTNETTRRTNDETNERTNERHPPVIKRLNWINFVVIVLMEDFLKAAIPKIPTLAGVKFTSGDMFDLGRCLILEDQRFSIMFGGDEVI